MKKYNEKLLDASKKLSQDTLKKSAKTVNRLTNPSSKVAYVGSIIGIIVGIGLLVGGLIGIILGKVTLGVGGLIASEVTIASNVISLKKRR